MQIIKSKEEIIQELSLVVNAIKKSDKACYSKKLSKQTNVNEFIVENTINILMNLSYLKNVLTPTGILKNFKIDRNSLDIVYFDYVSVMLKGQCVEGDINSDKIFENSKNIIIKYKDIALKQDLKFITTYDLEKEIVQDIFNIIFKGQTRFLKKQIKFDVNQLPIAIKEFVEEEKNNNIEIDILKDFPFCKEKITAIESEISKYIITLDDILILNNKNKEKYDAEIRLTEQGKRWKNVVVGSRIIGEETIYLGSKHHRYSLSSDYNDHFEHKYETVPIKENIIKKVKNYPEKIICNDSEIKNIEEVIFQNKNEINLIKSNLNRYEFEFKKEYLIKKITIEHQNELRRIKKDFEKNVIDIQNGKF